MKDCLERLWQKLSLTEEESNDVKVEGHWLEDTLEMGKSCLIGKLLIKQNVNMEAIENVFVKI
ncbi:hypothetical protein PTKIN_Ptkin13bG0012000 [Pterospermum kingtungense]